MENRLFRINPRWLDDEPEAPPLKLRDYPTKEQVEAASSAYLVFWYRWLRLPTTPEQREVFKTLRDLLGHTERMT